MSITGANIHFYVWRNNITHNQKKILSSVNTVKYNYCKYSTLNNKYLWMQRLVSILKNRLKIYGGDKKSMWEAAVHLTGADNGKVCCDWAAGSVLLIYIVIQWQWVISWSVTVTNFVYRPLTCPYNTPCGPTRMCISYQLINDLSTCLLQTLVMAESKHHLSIITDNWTFVSWITFRPLIMYSYLVFLALIVPEC